ncbi:MAG: hypothetical protein LQ338_001286 [Usnochroma carphineum]|nr:MAG: hypothetical protein LQ338_001286 [Usnochroma carphineum]
MAGSRCPLLLCLSLLLCGLDGDCVSGFVYSDSDIHDHDSDVLSVFHVHHRYHPLLEPKPSPTNLNYKFGIFVIYSFNIANINRKLPTFDNLINPFLNPPNAKHEFSTFFIQSSNELYHSHKLYHFNEPCYSNHPSVFSLVHFIFYLFKLHSSHFDIAEFRKHK